MRKTALLLTLLSTLARAQSADSSFGHARTRELAELGRLPTSIDVAVADIVNYHRHRLPLPRKDDEAFLELRYGNQLVGPDDEVVLQFGYTTAPADDRTNLPPLNLALVIDRSGSMSAGGKLDHVKDALRAFVRQLRPADRVALITYSDDAAVDQPSRALGDGGWLIEAIGALQAGGATNLHAGLIAGMKQVQSHAQKNTSNRVLLLTDGIANRGITDAEAILAEARAFTEEDIDLSTIGVGQDLDTALLDRLARGGRGLFHFVAEPRDVQKVFVQEYESLTTPVGRRVRLTIDLPQQLQLVRVYGHSYESLRGDDRDYARDDRDERGERLRIDLPNLNRGLTSVVMLACRRDPRWPLERGAKARVRGSLHFEAPTGVREFGVDEPFIAMDSHQEPYVDPEVRKNFTIATLAQGMHEMARQAEDRRWAAASDALQRALRFSRTQFTTDDEADVARVRSMAEAHARTLQRYVDRFRDF